MKSVFIVRPGAIGDAFETSSVCAAYKKLGFHVTVGISKLGAEVLKHCPHVDAFVLDDTMSLGPVERSKAWAKRGMDYDVFLPLIQVVEGTLIASTAFSQFHMSPQARHKLCNHNYLEFLHLAANVRHEPQIKFYMSEEEKEWARSVRANIKERFVLLFSLHGSSNHKVWPHTQAFIRKAVKKHPDLHIILTGQEWGNLYTKEWNDHPRVTNSCEGLPVRHALSLTSIADCILGPETGLMYARAFEDVPKIIMLSHATVENLTRDWKNTTSLWARDVWCAGRGQNVAPACHQIHESWQTCTRASDPNCLRCKNGSCTKHLAKCMQNIFPNEVLSALSPMIERQNEDERIAA